MSTLNESSAAPEGLGAEQAKVRAGRIATETGQAPGQSAEGPPEKGAGPEPPPAGGTEEDESALPPLRKNHDFQKLWIGAGLSQFGGRVSAIAYPLLIIWHGKSVAEAGLVSFAALLPNLLVQLPAGVLVDRVDRRRAMITCDAAAFIAMAAVVATLLSGRLWVPLIMAAAFIEGSGTICYRLAERAAIRNVVRRDQLSTALSRNESRGQASGLLGNPVSTALFTLQPWLPFAVSGLGRVGAYIGLVRIKTPFQQPGTTGRPRNLRAELAEGFRWLWGQRFMRSAVALVAGTNILFQIMSLTLVVTVRQHHGSPLEIGAIGVASGVGGVLGALSGSFWMKRFTPAAIMTGAFVLWAGLMASVAFTASPFALGAIYASMAGVGAAMNVTAGVYQTKICPDELQGRASSFAVLASSGANSIGALTAGFLLASFGTVHTALSAGAIMAVLVVIALASPAIRSGNEIIG
jgi:MFS family permease